MPEIKKEKTYSIVDDKETLIIRQDSIGNLELAYKEKNYADPQGFAFIPSEFIPHLIEVLRELSKEKDEATLAEPEPERFTVEEISNLSKHRENYIFEDHRDGIITLDGHFSRVDLQELSDSIRGHATMNTSTKEDN